MKTVEIEEGDTIIFKHFDSHAEYKLEKINIIRVRIGQFTPDVTGDQVNFLKVTLASVKFEVKSADTFNLEPDKEENTTQGVN